MLASIVFLTPLGAIVAAAALVPLAGVAVGAARVARVRVLLGLSAPPAGTDLAVVVLPALVILLLGLAASQPAVSHQSAARVRTDAEALFVFDTSLSMAASSGPRGQTRLDRAVAAAQRLRVAIPDVESGVATLTDRVLPDLLPVPDAAAFDATVRQAVGIEEPPPRGESVRATTYTALAAVPTSGYFTQAARKRVLVLLTDGESSPLDPGAVANALAARPRTAFLAVRFWRSDEAIYGASGRPDPSYRPDPSGRAQLAALAAATHGRAFEEGDLGAGAAALRSMFGQGPTRPLNRTRSTNTLAPYVALAALLPLGLGFRRRGLRR